MKEAILKINKTNSSFFVKINMVDEPFSRLIKKNEKIKSRKLEMKKGRLKQII